MRALIAIAVLLVAAVPAFADNSCVLRPSQLEVEYDALLRALLNAPPGVPPDYRHVEPLRPPTQRVVPPSRALPTPELIPLHTPGAPQPK